MIHVRPLKRLTVEEEAYKTLRDYERLIGKPLVEPIDVDLIGEGLYGLRWDWDVIDEADVPPTLLAAMQEGQPCSTMILAGLYPRDRRVVLNERHVAIFQAKPGLERFTKGHEIGHWVLHIDKSVLDMPTLPGMDEEETIICRDGDDSWIERQANWFSGALLMPSALLLPAAQQYPRLQWKSLYELAERFGVTISAMSVRVNQCGLSYVDNNGTIHESRAAFVGQETF
jgi:hypothetical protein